MKTIGLLGGMSWESSAIYYRLFNQQVKERLGGHHSAKVLMLSVDFHEVATRQKSGAWDELTQMMIDGARQLEKGGADCVLIGTNTMHKMAKEVQESISIPLFHVVDALTDAVKTQNLEKVALFGTRFTMEDGFYAERMQHNGVQALIPNGTARDTIHRVIYDELVLGKVEEVSRIEYVNIILDCMRHGAQGVVLGCTEICMLIQPEDSPLPVFDTTTLHANYAVDWALS
jgi:aspartate racemase